MLRKLILFTVLSATFAVAPLARAAQPGQSALPKDESATENDLDEDDGSPTPDHAAATSPSDDIPLSDEADSHAAAVMRAQGDQGPPPEMRPPASSGEPRFDWQKHQGEREVDHPLSERGLIRIDKDKNYYYRVDETPHHHAASVHVGTLNPTRLANPVPGPNSSFADNYGQSSNPTLILEYEWQGWRSAIGKFGLRAGSGAFVAQGHGHFVKNDNVADGVVTPMEEFTFIALPNTVGAVYRMQLFHNQLFVPYAEGGGIVWTFAETRDDGKGPKFGGSLSAYGAAGVAMNLTYFDYVTRVQLDREYGINSCYLTVEYRHLFALSQHFDFTSDFINAGVLMEF